MRTFVKFVLLIAFVLLVQQQSDGSYIVGLHKSFYITDEAQSTINVTAGIVFDPSYTGVSGDYERIYLVNRSGDNAKRGLYSVDIATETSSARLALGGDSSNDLDQPFDVTADSSGNVYAIYANTPSVWKVANPSGSPVETQLLGNYGDTGLDDDPASLTMVPVGFGGSYTPDADLVFADNGMDDNANEIVAVLDATSTPESPLYSTLWSDMGGDDLSVRVDSSIYDGYVYLATTSLRTTTYNGTDYYYINRINASGVEQILLDIDTAQLRGDIDDAIAVNPADGAIYTVAFLPDDSRVICRIDTANAVDLGGGVYLASISQELAISYNVGTNAMAISPDGKFLALAAPDGQDMLYVYTLPEPATIILIGCGLLFARRRLSHT